MSASKQIERIGNFIFIDHGALYLVRTHGRYSVGQFVVALYVAYVSIACTRVARILFGVGVIDTQPQLTSVYLSVNVDVYKRQLQIVRQELRVWRLVGGNHE